MKYSNMTRRNLMLACLFVGCPTVAVATEDAQGKIVINNTRVIARMSTALQPLAISAEVDSVVIGMDNHTVVFVQKGAVRKFVAKRDSREVIVELKENPVSPLINTSGHPDAFPRAGVNKIFENDRIVAWDNTWSLGSPTPMHFHARDVVAMFLVDGALKSTLRSGESTVSEHTAGLVKFSPRDRTHTETLIKGAGHAIIIELK